MLGCAGPQLAVASLAALERPAPGRHRLADHFRADMFDQYRIVRGIAGHHFLWRSGNAAVVLPDHCDVHRVPASQRQATSTEVVARQLWDGRQRLRSSVPHPSDLLHHVAIGSACDRSDYVSACFVKKTFRSHTNSNRNWSPVMLGGILIIAMTFYVVKGRHEYTGPVVHVRRVE